MRGLVITVLLLGLVGCSSAPPQMKRELKQSWQTYGTVKAGMERSQVHRLLGEPAFVSSPLEGLDEVWITGCDIGFPRFYVLIGVKYGRDGRVLKIHKEKHLHTPLFHRWMKGVGYA
jgi:hypothetical protein